MLSLTNTQANKRTFLSAPLKQPLRISGTPIVELAGLAEQDAVEPHGADRRLRPEHADRRAPATASANAQPGGRAPAGASRCRTTRRASSRRPSRQQNVTQWRVTKGMMDSSNRNSLRVAEPVTIGQKYRFTWPSCPRTSRSPPATGSGS